ncbi:MAG TPA: nitroreductase/quinone reductase family protein [Myxococcota bacterium]|nr:nitroreductase/quinone reductase family protein [Myxococcota bacterium]
MKVLRILVIAALVYVGIVVLFESLLGWVQPSGGGTVVITTYDPDGTAHDRVVSRIDHEGKLYIAANHWPRAWYHRVLANPKISVTADGTKADYTAVPISGADYDQVNGAHALPIFFRILTGFPERLLVRLDPAAPPAAAPVTP